MNYKVVATGSSGNCILLNEIIALDIGISFKEIRPYYKKLKMVLIGHCHTDHLKKSTIKKLAFERPKLLFGVGEYLVQNLIDLGVNPKNIIIINNTKIRIQTKDFDIQIKGYELKHDVPNQGFEICMNNKRMFYATDTKNLEGISVKDCDLYLIEGNYKEEEMQERIKRKIESNQFVNEYRTIETHQSVEDASNWLLENMKDTSAFEFIHAHKERKVKNEKGGSLNR